MSGVPPSHPFSAYALSTGNAASQAPPPQRPAPNNTIPPPSNPTPPPQLSLDAGRELLSMLRSSNASSSAPQPVSAFPSVHPSDLFRPTPSASNAPIPMHHMRPVDAFGPSFGPVPQGVHPYSVNQPPQSAPAPSASSSKLSLLMNDLSQYKASVVNEQKSSAQVSNVGNP
jgi:hypothetical protein